jgi:hypothetical protein
MESGDLEAVTPADIGTWGTPEGTTYVDGA